VGSRREIGDAFRRRRLVPPAARKLEGDTHLIDHRARPEANASFASDAALGYRTCLIVFFGARVW